MSGGEYQLVRTDSQDEENWEDEPPETLPSPSTRAVLDRIRALSRLTTNHKYALISSTRHSRNPETNSSSTSFLSLLTSSTGGPKGRILLLCSLLMGLLVMSTMFWTPWDLLEDVFYVQTFLPSPSTACLLDPSSPSSYVQWNPYSNRNRNVYHCITQRIPNPPSPSFKQSPHSPLSRSSAVGSALRTWRPLPDTCLDAYYTNGSSCSDGQRTRFDIVWTWVNGSDPMIIRAKTEALAALKQQQQQQKSGTDDQDNQNDDDSDQEAEAVNAHLYRDHDELRHSLRSVLQYFRDSAANFFILTSDFVFPDIGAPFEYPFNGGSSGPGTFKTKGGNEFIDGEYVQSEEELLEYARLGLLPQWLQFNLPPDEFGEQGEGDALREGIREGEGQVIGKWKDGDISLEVVHHAEVYNEYDGTVFNSNSIESQLGNVVGDKAFIYFNDDCFFNAPLSSGDFHSSPYGLVFRLVAYPWMLVRPQHYPVDSGLGEWHPMEFTNWLISKRFGVRLRPYPMHQVKVLQGSLMREMWGMWDEQEKINMGHKFRGLGGLDQVEEDRTRLEEIDPLERPRSVEVEEVDEDLIELRSVSKEERSQFSKRNDITLPARTLPRRTVAEPKERLGKRGIDLDEDEDDDVEGGGGRPSPSYPTGENGITDDGDAHVMFLFTHFVIERSREGMLWSWIVASLGTDEDVFEAEQRDIAWQTLTVDAEAEVESNVNGSKLLNVLVERRQTMEPWRVGWRLGEVGDRTEAATYLFSSQDGDAYSYYDDMDGLEWWHHGSTSWPQLWNGDNFAANVTERPNWASCTVDWDVCFDSNIHRASELFKHVAFEKRECGDCILKALVRASGPLGLSAILPSPQRIYRQSGGDDKTKGSVPTSSNVSPHLPLTTDWRTTDFSLSSVFASGFWNQSNGVPLRQWVQRLLEKYRYVIADTENLFEIIHNPVEAENAAAKIDDHKTAALVTINDNVDQSPEETDRRMREWLDLRWSTPAAWESPDSLSAQVIDYDSIYRKRSLASNRR